MSVCTFIAADIALDEIRNPHYKTLSINEALAMGIEISEEFISSEIDRDKPDMILWSDTELVNDIDNKKLFDGDLVDDFALLAMDDSRLYCEKNFAVYIEWKYYTEERAKRIIEYIREVLSKTDCVEIWKVWLSYYDLPKVKTMTINIKDLQPAHINQIDEYNLWDNKLITDTYGIDTPIYHCLKITK